MHVNLARAVVLLPEFLDRLEKHAGLDGGTKHSVGETLILIGDVCVRTSLHGGMHLAESFSMHCLLTVDRYCADLKIASLAIYGST